MALSMEITFTYNAFEKAYELWQRLGFTERLKKLEGLERVTCNHALHDIKIENLDRSLKRSKEKYSFNVSKPVIRGKGPVYIGYINPIGSELGRLDIHDFDKLIEDRESWLEDIYSCREFIQCRVYNTEYNSRQNTKSIERYERKGWAHEHLPKINNGRPIPLNADEIDTRFNPGYWTFRQGYLESIGSEMWLGRNFFNRVNLDVNDLKQIDWLEFKELNNGVVYIKSYEAPFDTAEGEQKSIQGKLRQLLYSNQSLSSAVELKSDKKYAFLIKKTSGEITFSEWVTAVSKIQGIKFVGEPSIGKNPLTGEIITVGGDTNRVELNISQPGFKEEWVSCIFYQNGQIGFDSIDDVESPGSSSNLIISKLAKEFGANIYDREDKLCHWLQK